MKKQSGFVLVSVLVITTITTMLAFSQINNNRLQERISGNQKKQISAQLAAEKGMVVAFETIDTMNKAGDSNAQILSALQSLPVSGENYSFPTLSLDVASHTFTIISKGEVYGATSYLKTQISAQEEIGSSHFNDAVAGCDGVAIGSGGGMVDSYNSQKGDYEALLADGTINKSENGSVATINDNADIELSGTGKVYGDIVSNGDISTGTSSASDVKGNITAKGNIQLNDITAHGNIHAGGNLAAKKLSAPTADTAITVVGDITQAQNMNINASVQVDYGGTDVSGNYGLATSGLVAPDTDMGVCDVIGISALVTNIGTEISNNSLPTSSSPMGAGSSFVFTDSSVTADASLVAGISSTTVAALGAVSGLGKLDENSKVLIIDDAVTIDGKTIEIDGNVTLLIRGDITIKNTSFTFTDPDISSLTIVTAGKIDIDTGVEMFTGETVNAEGNPPLTIYSSFDSVANSNEDALNISANADMYAKLYAPLGNLTLGGGAEIMGAVRGKEVSVEDGTGVHFDEVLSDFNDEIISNVIPASYSSVYYHYQ